MIEINVRIVSDKDNPLTALEQRILDALGSQDTGSKSVTAAPPKAAPKPAPKPKPAPEPEPEPEPEDEEPEEKPAPAKRAPAKRAPAKKAPELPEADEDEDEDAADGPTLEDAVARATALVEDGKADQVKAALKAVGAKRVTELSGSALADFLDELA